MCLYEKTFLELQAICILRYQSSLSASECGGENPVSNARAASVAVIVNSPLTLGVLRPKYHSLDGDFFLPQDQCDSNTSIPECKSGYFLHTQYQLYPQTMHISK